ncbi:ATP-binding cassette domain-containing protein [Paludifilum halophilum]|uniref:ABC transporter domain-containing protein n=1 Tax=Paludifilum halophilum TaxID=1642702 RepID=A0A235B4W5_9BACL|nr:ATP-binding cassette domain-containing protein [Paludifilum halophilum]OYD07323.1 hypothetical protein CHM34_10425 [Paludifilum halophilum]
MSITDLQAHSDPFVEIKNLTVASVKNRGKTVVRKLVEDFSLSIRSGEMVGLVGESGSGKSVTAAALLDLLPKALQVTAGDVLINGTSLYSMTQKERRRLRGRKIAYIFQDYQGSFTPFFKIGKQMVETIRSHRAVSVREAKETALSWLDRVHLPPVRAYESIPFNSAGASCNGRHSLPYS